MMQFTKLSMKQLIFATTNDKVTSLGLLVSRIPFCFALFHYHGLEKVTGYGTMVEHFRNPLGFGTHFTLAFALLADSICSLLILFGIITRPAAVIVFVNVLVAMVFVHPWEQRILLYIGFYALIALAGAGRYSLDFLFFNQSHEAQVRHVAPDFLHRRSERS